MMKNYISLIAFCLFFQANINAQIVPCDNGMAGDYPCNDYDLMSRIPRGELGNSSTNFVNDIWGWTDPDTNKEYAIVGLNNATAFVDVTDPVNPIKLGRLDTAAGSQVWRDVKTYNNHAFIVADNVGDHGMQVFDLKRLRGVTTYTVFTADATLKDGLGSCHNIVINESEAVAYLVGCGRSPENFDGGPVFVDISDPLNPSRIGGFSEGGYSHDAQVVTYNGPDGNYKGKEIYIGSNEDEIVVADVTDKNNVTKISALDYANVSYTHQGWFTEDQRFFILGDETDEFNGPTSGGNTRTIVFDLEDLDSPKVAFIYDGPTTASDHNGYVKGNTFYLSNYRAGLRVIDITNIAANSDQMTEIGFFDTYPANNNSPNGGLWSNYPYFKSGNIILSDTERGLFVVRKSNTLSTDDFNFDQKFTLSPNPTSSNAIIKVSGNSSQVESVEVYNVLGQSVFKKDNINKSIYILPMNNRSKGIYLVKINDRVTKKLVLR